jgi:membrane-bound ClpP family serine protease
MAIFEHKHFGTPISKELSNYIIYNFEKGDIKEIAEKHHYNPLTLTAIIRRNRNLTEANAPMVIDLFRRCIRNYNSNQRTKESINELIQKAK